MMACLFCHHAAITIHYLLHHISHDIDSFLTCFQVISHTGTTGYTCWNYQFRQWELLVPFIYTIVKLAFFQLVRSNYYRNTAANC